MDRAQPTISETGVFVWESWYCFLRYSIDNAHKQNFGYFANCSSVGILRNHYFLEDIVQVNLDLFFMDQLFKNKFLSFFPE